MRTRAADRRASPAEARARAAAWSAAGERVALATGTFDLLLAGHARALERLRPAGTRLVVAVLSDRAAARGPGRPVLAAADRAGMVAALRCVDAVVVVDDPADPTGLASLDLAGRVTDLDAMEDPVERVRARLERSGG